MNQPNLYDSSLLDFNDNNLDFEDFPRQSILTEQKKTKYRKFYNSKWANLKFFLQDKSSLEASVNLLKTKTIKQFSTKCKEIYSKKIETHLLARKNRNLIIKGFSSLLEGYEDMSSKITVSDGVTEFPPEIQTFFFIFRESNHLMLKLIENIDNTKEINLLAPFLCHFFYENFYMESTEQEEMIYIIYLLLEKEIDNLITPGENTFLSESFISAFLSQMCNRYEIKNYIDIILNELICNLEELHSEFYFLEISRSLKNARHEDIYEITPEGFLMQKVQQEVNSNISSTNTSKSLPSLDENEPDSSKKSLPNNFSNSFLLKILPIEVGVNINEKFLMGIYKKEENKIIKDFILKQIKKIRNSYNKNIYDSYQLFEFLIKKKKTSKNSIIYFREGVKVIQKFIDQLLSNLEDDTIIPNSIKIICKFIYILTKKKFKQITKLELNNFVGRFLFDKLILPFLKNPDLSEASKSKILGMQTRRNLINIYLVFKNLVKGELFNYEQNINMVVFNKFIIDNYYRINNIIDKILDVEIPEKLKRLSEQFYKNNDFILDNSKRSEEEINYDYFKENPNDFMQHKSICFSLKELYLFHNIVRRNEPAFIEKGKPLEKVLDSLSKFISSQQDIDNHYYVIISDNYNKEAKELLFHKEETKPLGTAKTKEEIIQNLHYCISFLIGKMEILPHWEWVVQNYKTEDTFENINEYLNSYEEINILCNDSIPLNWYSLYIINNLKNVSSNEAMNDYQLLYDDIEKQIREQLKRLSRLNEFLTVNMTNKFLLIDNKIKIFEEELENVKNTFINIKALQFMDYKDSNDLLCSLANIEELNNKGCDINKFEYTGKKNIILQKETYRPNKNDKNKKKEKVEDIPSHLGFFCYSISEFKYRFMSYYKNIYKEIREFKENKNKRSSNIGNGNEENNIETNAKEVLEKYMELVLNSLERNRVFDFPIEIDLDLNIEQLRIKIKRESILKVTNEETDEEEEQPKDIPTQFREKAQNSILNHILKSLCVKCYFERKILKEDENFYKKCVSLSWVKPENLYIPEDIIDEFILNNIIEHMKKMDEMRTPEGMLNEFGFAVQMINSSYIFMTVKPAEANDLLPIIIYSIIKARPQRMIFNIRFIEFFFDNKDLKGALGYNLIQAKSSIAFINDSINGKSFGISEEEFQKRCSECAKLENL